MRSNIRGFIDICKEIEIVGCPNAYKEGAKAHDAGIFLDYDAPEEFGIGIRKDGVDLFIPAKNEYIEMALSCRKHGTNEYYRWWKRGAFEPITVDQLVERLLKRSGRYVKDCMDMETGKLISYAWPGGGAVLYLDKENNVLCSDCANENDPQFDLPIVAGFVHEEGPSYWCDGSGCGKELPSECGDPDDEE